VRLPLFNSEKPTEFIPEQLKLLDDVEEEAMANPIDSDYEAGLIANLNDKWDNQVNPFN
jgi:hypothetical protein